MRESWYPNYVKEKERWVWWRAELLDNGHYTKIPINAATGLPLNYKLATSLFSFEFAKRLAVGTINLGYVLDPQDDLVFVDVDDCISGDKLSDIGRYIGECIGNSYVELSHSGKGLHFLVKGKIARNFKNSKYGVEMYCRDRYVALTGNSLNRAEPILNQEGLDKVFNKFCTEDGKEEQAKTNNKARVFDKAEQILKRVARRSDKLKSLVEGDYEEAGFSDRSVADYVLAKECAFYADGDADLVIDCLVASGLYRKKFERKDYLERTAKKACRDCDYTLSDYMEEKGFVWDEAQ
ncbi:MAG: hypothetical protein MJ132_06325 [Clostridia bacterium]|nr:hypothetical protein [Clostridia bacterium]